MKGMSNGTPCSAKECYLSYFNLESMFSMSMFSMNRLLDLLLDNKPIGSKRDGAGRPFVLNESLR